MENISKKIKEYLPRKVFQLLVQISKMADARGIKLFAVGGFVRDIFLGIENYDIDLATETNAIDFALVLADRLKGNLVVHGGFKTASVTFGNKTAKKIIRVDLATTRTEIYKKPQALPNIKPATIKEDLFRRDFTINAVAVSLNSATFGSLIDFFGGIRDLKTRKIRVLHDLSFIDDPTRILRAVRLGERLGFDIEPHTRRLMRQAIALDVLSKIQKRRLKKETDLIFEEPDPARTILRMRQAGVKAGIVI